jgi:hypothetical protein
MAIEETARDTTEHQRLRDADAGRAPWRRWGPYLAERAWGTVREDYSDNGDAWDAFPFSHAHARAYRWNEDGLAGICDLEQRLCLAFAFWNEQDSLLKERLFGLTNGQGNHGEDVKERYWYVDSTPSHSYMTWRYHYPHAAFPYDELVEVNAGRSRDEAEFEIDDTHVFDNDAYFDIEVAHAKVHPEEIAIEVRATNRSHLAAPLHLLPTLWFRNTWSWSEGVSRPEIVAEGSDLLARHPQLAPATLRGDGEYELMFCENETNLSRVFGVEATTPYPKDGISDAIVHGDRSSTNPDLVGTKAAMHYHKLVAPGETWTIRLVLAVGNEPSTTFDDTMDALFDARRAEADAFYRSLTPADATVEEASVMRQAFAGMLWSKQFYHYDVERWLAGDDGQPNPPNSRLAGRNVDWSHFNAMDVISMPDTWEYPWFAVWDLAFHCVTMAHVDPAFAKRQLILICREWYMHPSGALPAYEWNFDDSNPPVHAWAALRVFEIDGGTDYAFLERIFHKLLINFTWWVNRKDLEGNNLFQGGFLGLDNIGPLNRSAMPPELGHLEQSDGTAWMAMYCLNMLEIALVLAIYDDTYEDLATKFFEHFAYIATAMDTQGLWNDEEGFYFDVVHLPDGTSQPLPIFSVVGLIALNAVTVLTPEVATQVPQFMRRLSWFLSNKPQYATAIPHVALSPEGGTLLLSIVGVDRLKRILSRVFAEDEFLSPYGLRALSRYHREHPLDLNLAGVELRLDYEPGESHSPLYGGNSNWRGPVWFPVNYLFLEALQRFATFCGDDVCVEYPTGAGQEYSLGDIAMDLRARLVALFLPQADGIRPSTGTSGELIWFHEYFHGDTGKGLGASHQTGWTGLVADLITTRKARRSLPATTWRPHPPTGNHQTD